MKRPAFRFALGCSQLALVFLAVMTAGCQRQPPAAPAAAAEAEYLPVPLARVKPERKTVRRVIEQPARIEAYEETPIHAKISGYVKTVAVDIGNEVTKDAVLAELWVPEMDVELAQRDALVKEAEAEVKLARESVASAEAEFKRSKAQYDRLTKLSKSVLDKENIEESEYAFEAARAHRDMAQASVLVKEARANVARQNRDYTKTLLDYAKIRAPFAGVIAKRNVDTGHFLATSSGKGDPLFVVVRQDPVRVFVETPETDAGWINNGDQATIRVQALPGQLFQAPVTRTAWVLDAKARTLKTEIDLPNSQGKLRPGMYAYGTIEVVHPKAWTVPASAIFTEEQKTFCYFLVEGKPVKTRVQTGLREGNFVEVVGKVTGKAGTWEEFSGAEDIVEHSQQVLAKP